MLCKNAKQYKPKNFWKQILGCSYYTGIDTSGIYSNKSGNANSRTSFLIRHRDHHLIRSVEMGWILIIWSDEKIKLFGISTPCPPWSKNHQKIKKKKDSCCPSTPWLLDNRCALTRGGDPLVLIPM